jgi:LacI family transcriptional regulator
MDSDEKRPGTGRAGAGRSVTIKDLAAELDLSITTISRALNGYSDVGEKTRDRVGAMARQMGYRPNRNAQRLVTRRTHNVAWVQPDNERKFLDPHFVEVMAGVLRGARAAHYDILLSSDTPNRELATYDRYVRDNSVDGFIVDLPREGDARVTYLLEAGRPFVVHGREPRHAQYGWVDVDNYGNFYQLTRLLIANGHRHIAFINGDETFNYALYRSSAARDAVADAGLPPEALTIHNSLHPMGDAGYALTAKALADDRVTAILYSSSLMAVEGHAAIQQLGERRQGPVAMASMDDGLHYLDLGRVAGRVSFVRSSLREAGIALIGELVRQCEHGGPPQGHLLASSFHVAPGLDAGVLDEPLPANRR